MTQAPTLVNGSETTAVGQIYIGPRPAAGIREVRRDLTVDGTRLGIDGIAGSAGILTIQTPVGLGGDPESAYVSLHVLETSPHRSLAHLPIWDEGAEESDGECSQCVCQTHCHEFRSKAIGREILQIGSPSAGPMTVLKYLYKDWFGVKRGHPDMPDLKAYVLDRDFNADYPTRTRPESRQMAKDLIGRYSIVERSDFPQGTLMEMDPDGDEEVSE